MSTLFLWLTHKVKKTPELDYLVAKNQALGVKIDALREKRAALKGRIDFLIASQ
jgi:hypothetical protein